MSDEKAALTIVVQSRDLTPREEGAYHMHMKSGDVGLSPSLQAELFELYLSGNTLEEIWRRNQALRLGAIVRAFIEGDWQLRRQEYVNALLGSVKDRVQQVQVEAVHFTADGLAVIQKRIGNDLKRYLQTGNKDDLGDAKDWGLHQFKQLVEMLLKLTGQDGQKTIGVNVKGSVNHTASPAPAAPLQGPLSEEQASALLATLYNLPTQK